MSKPGKPGRARVPAALQEQIDDLERLKLQAISIRISLEDLQRAREIGEKTGLGYQTVLKQAIKVGLGKD